MGRPSKGPRLYLRRDGDKKRWIIRDNGYDTSTGFEEHEELPAMRILAEYKRGQPLPMRTSVGMGLVYFVTCMTSPHYPIKIGWTGAAVLARRMEQLQIANPNLLTTLATTPGTYNDEKMLHAYFAHLLIRGEWFRRGDDLLEYIVRLPGYSDSYGADEFAPAESDICAAARDQPNAPE